MASKTKPLHKNSKPDPYAVDDDNPLWTKKEFSKAKPALDTPALAAVVKRGRPKVINPKIHTGLRLDPDVLAYFKADGKGWQTRINQALREVAGLGH